MNFGLKDFFMGVVHLFVIFLPGAVVLLTIMYAFPSYRDIEKSLGVSGIGATILFVGASYFLGHVVSLAASSVEDFFSSGARSGEMGETKAAIRRTAFEICADVLSKEIITRGNLRKWCTYLVRKEGGTVQGDVDMKDADRRFFRNIRLVLLIAVFIVLLKIVRSGFDDRELVIAGTGLVIATAVAFLRYINQDAKFTNLVFESLLVINADEYQFGTHPFTHGGGVIFRKYGLGLKVRYLLVTAKENDKEWVLPKGHIDPGESPEEAAIREAVEESGVVPKMRAFLGYTHFTPGKEYVPASQDKIHLANFLITYDEIDEKKKKKDEKRRTQEFSYNDARKELKHPESKAALKWADEIVRPGWIGRWQRSKLHRAMVKWFNKIMKRVKPPEPSAAS